MQKSRSFTTTLVIYATAMVLLLTLQIIASLGAFSNLSDEGIEIISSLLPQLGIMLGIPLLMLLIDQKRRHEPVSLIGVVQDVGWRKLSAKHVCFALVLGVCLYIFNIFVASVFGGILQSGGYQYPDYPNVFHGYSGLIITIILSAVLPGICEEFLHRGILLNGMVQKFGIFRGVMWVSVLFGLMHLNVGQFFYATVLGWFMCLTALSAKSLWASIIVHFTNNALSTYMSYADELSLPGAAMFSRILSNPLLLILLLIVVLVIIGGILRAMAQENFNKNLDAYTVRYLAAQDKFDNSNFEEIRATLPKVIAAMPTWKATFAYIETFVVPQKTKPLERAILVSILVLGVTITALSFMWGTW